MSPIKLRYFIAIARAGSLGGASKVIGVAQSALSRHVSDLEATIGAPLFERTGRGVTITPVGALLLDEAERLVAGIDQSLHHLRAAATGSSDRLTIAVNAVTLQFPVALQAIAAFSTRFPKVKLRLPIMRSVDQIAHLRDHKIDAGFLMERPQGLSDVGRYAVGKDSFRVALPRIHSLAAKPVLSLGDLEGLPCIVISGENLWGPQFKILQRCHSHGFRPDMRAEVASQQLQLELIDRELGYGFVNASVGPSLPRGVILRRVTELDERLELEFVYLQKRENRHVQAFRSELARIIRENDRAG